MDPGWSVACRTPRFEEDALIHRPSLLLSVLLLLAGRPASGENLLAAGKFDSPEEIEAWTVTSDPGTEASMTFEAAIDAGACAGSGSAILATSGSFPHQADYEICIGSVTGGEEYRFGLEIYFPHGQGPGGLYWSLDWFDEPNCGGNFLYGSSVGPVGIDPDWQPVQLTTTTPEEGASARVRLELVAPEEPNQPYLYVDRVFVQPVADVFVDGFEVGETCLWSAISP